MPGQSRGPLSLSTLDLGALNRVLQQIREELDEIQGLRGAATVHGDVTVNGNVTINGSLKTGDKR